MLFNGLNKFLFNYKRLCFVKFVAAVVGCWEECREKSFFCPSQFFFALLILLPFSVVCLSQFDAMQYPALSPNLSRGGYLSYILVWEVDAWILGWVGGCLPDRCTKGWLSEPATLATLLHCSGLDCHVKPSVVVFSQVAKLSNNSTKSGGWAT